ncbi:smalltalk protein [Bacteroides thetaiotaomicron]|nr:smalltalk protein [Bacteroides thetaiotaomicron]MCA6055588.1 smalltalk protein [Bacteroides thetaiotaomicron]
MKRSLWDTILKVVIAVASAVAGVLGGNAMSL